MTVFVYNHKINSKVYMEVLINTPEEYWDHFSGISTVEKNETGKTVFRINDEYGHGAIKFIDISDTMSFAYMDFCLNHEVTINYNLEASHFEISCCIKGPVGIHDEEYGRITIADDSVMLIKGMKKGGSVKGQMILDKDRHYKNVSFSFNRFEYSKLHQSISDELWGRIFPQGPDCNANIVIMEKMYGVKYILRQIFETEFENVSLRNLFFEGKVLQIITLIADASMKRTSDIKLSNADREKIYKVPALMTQDLAKPYTISELATCLDIDTNKLKSGFKQLYGDTIYSYFKKIKLQEASHLLLTTDKSILEIAYDVGYQSQSQFGAAFKKQYGLTPYEYSRKNLPVFTRTPG